MILAVSIACAQNGEFHLDKSYKISDTGTVDLRCSDAKVFIIGSTRTSAHVKIDRKVSTKGWSWGGGDFRVEVDEQGGDLSIHQHESGTQVAVIGTYHEEYKIEIEVPSGVSLRVRGDDGDYYIKNIQGGIRLNLDDADAELVGCRGSQFEFRMDDGDIRMDGGTGSLEINGDDADIEIYHADFTNIQAHLDDGDLIIETALHDDGNYYLESEDGTIELKITSGGGMFNIRHDDARVITEGDFNHLEKSENESRLELKNGKAKVSIRVDDARVRTGALL
jgi:hypothetical protein